MNVCVEIPEIRGAGQYRIDVAGESFYQNNLTAICGERGIYGTELEVRAQLELLDDNPYDKHAVRVTIQGLQVGHLSREDARAFRRLVRYGPLSLHEAFECAALVCGGWDRGRGDTGHYGVRLDLTLYDNE